MELFKEGKMKSTDKSTAIKSINRLGKVKIEVIPTADLQSLKDLQRKVSSRIMRGEKICIFVIQGF